MIRNLRLFESMEEDLRVFRLLLAGLVLVLGFVGSVSAAAENELPFFVETSDTAFWNTPPTAEDEVPSLVESLRGESAGDVRIRYHQFTGTVRFMGTEPGNAVKTPANLSPGVSPEMAAMSFLDIYGPAFGIKDQSEELSVMKSKHVAGQARSFVRFQQRHNGVPVMGGELIVQVKDNNVVSINGETVPDIYLGTEPVIGADEARETALGAVSKWYDEGDGAGLRVTDPELWIYNPVLLGMEMNRNFLVWRMDVVSTELEPINELVLVDANLGGIVLHFNQVATAKNRIVYDNNNDYTAGLPGTGPVRTEGQGPTGIADVDLAYDYAGDTYDYYMTTHGRDGINGSGMDMISTVRFCPSSSDCPWAQAGWSGTYQQMLYGDGYASADDVVGHELTHGVTDYESHLYYYMQSGAINEHLSDMWGEFVDLTNGAGDDSAGVRWLMGEDLSIGAIRDMSDPTAYSDPDKMTSSNYACGSSDNGGVHSNSGVGNKLAYLLVDGDTFNSQTVTAIGMNKTAKIYYEAQTNMLTSGSDYADLADALRQSCLNLIGTAGINSSNCQQVENAILAVEMDQQPTSCSATEAPVCDTGLSPVNLFFDDMENTGSGNWAHGAVSGSVDEWYYPANGNPYGIDVTYAISGVNNFWGYNYNAVADYAIAMTSNVILPADTGYMHFSHSYDFDYFSSTYYDGGVIEYSTNGGSNWYDAGSLVSDNGYTGALSSDWSNPLGGRDAFAYISNGYISTRLNLSTLAGQNVRFRFRIGTDSLTDNRGWFIDDVRIYTCKAPPAINITLPENTTYNSSNVPLNVYANETIDTWWYSSDGGTNVTFVPNTTLTGLASGPHNVTVYANDTTGIIGASSTVYFTINDTTAPAINITSPQNTTYEQGDPINITYDSNESIVEQDYYSPDGGANTTFVNGTATITPGLGSHNITIWAKDASGNWGNDTEYFTVEDTTAPNLTFIYPTPEDNANLSATSVTINVSHVEANPGTLVLNWSGTNESYSYSGSYTNITKSGLVNGTYTYYVWANDTFGQSNQTETRTVTIDTVPPAITITAPTNTTYTSTSVNLKVSANETIDTWWYSLDGGANATFTPNATLSGLSNGQHNITVYANDSAGNVGVGEIEVAVESWSRTYDNGSIDEAYGVAVDSSGNVYVTGESNLSGNYDYYTIKYNSSGGVVWNATYNGGGVDHANGIAVDGSGNVYVTGYSNLSGNDYYTIKYNSSGTELWNATYDSGSDDEAYGVAVDGSGNVYVTGVTWSGNGDYYTIKYNSSGTELWNRSYDGGDYDEATGIAVDGSGNVYVTGGSYINGSNEDDYYTIKYDENGTELWNRSYDGGSGDIGLAVAADGSGNVYVTGSSTLTGDGDYYTIKYDENGTVIWNATYNGGSNDHANSVAVDGSGNVYVTGYSTLGGNQDYYTIKYDSSGSEVWNHIYDGGSSDSATGVAVDGSGNVYVTGTSYLGGNEDYHTIKYSEVTGPVYFTISATPPPSSPGGGGGGPAPAEDQETEGTTVTPTEADVVVQVDAAFSSIPKDKTGTISLPETEDMFLTEIAIKVKNKVSNVKVVVKTLTSKPAEIAAEIAGEVFGHLKIDHENIEDDDIDEVTIKFKVDKTWIAEKSIDAVVLNRFSDDRWNALATTKDSEDEQYVHYSAVSPGLSVFGISGQVRTVTAILPGTTDIPTIAAQETTAPPPAMTTPPPEEPKKGICGPTAVLLIAMLSPALLHVRRRSR